MGQNVSRIANDQDDRARILRYDLVDNALDDADIALGARGRVSPGFWLAPAVTSDHVCIGVVAPVADMDVDGGERKRPSAQINARTWPSARSVLRSIRAISSATPLCASGAERRSDVASAHDAPVRLSRTPGLVFHGSPSAL